MLETVYEISRVFYHSNVNVEVHYFVSEEFLYFLRILVEQYANSRRLLCLKHERMAKFNLRTASNSYLNFFFYYYYL